MNERGEKEGEEREKKEHLFHDNFSVDIDCCHLPGNSLFGRPGNFSIDSFELAVIR